MKRIIIIILMILFVSSLNVFAQENSKYRTRDKGIYNGNFALEKDKINDVTAKYYFEGIFDALMITKPEIMLKHYSYGVDGEI